MCNGLLLRFHSPPPLTIYPPESSAANPSQIPTIRSFIPDLLSRGVLRRILSPQPLFYSRLFLVRKKDGPFRLVIDLSRLNKCLEVPTFRMETVSSIASGIIQELWGCTIDLQDAFFNVPVSWVFHKYLAFILDGAVYVFQYLPFGLAVAPWAFSRVVRPIKGHCHLLGIRLHSYLDDFIVLQLSRKALRRDTSTILDLFQSLAIAVNVKKSHLTPSQTVEYLGVIFHLDTLTLSLTSSKVQSISSLCNSLMHSSCQSRRELEHLIGVLNFASYLVPLGRLRLRPLVSWMNSNTSTSTRDLPVPLGAPFKSALRMWLDKDYLRSHVPTFVPPPSLQLMTDASLTGWSGVLLPLSVSGYWPPSCTGSPIHWLELMAVMLSTTLRSAAARQPCPGDVGQHHHGLMSLTPRLLPFRNYDVPDPGYIGVLPTSLHYTGPQTSQRELECLRRPRIPHWSNCHRMVSGPFNLPVALRPGWSVSSGPVCHQGQRAASGVRLSIPRPISCGNQRVLPALERLDINLPVPSGQGAAQGSVLPMPIQRAGHPSRPLFCSIRLVSIPPPEGSGPGPSSGIPLLVAAHQGGQGAALQPLGLQASRVVTMRMGLIKSGLDTGTVDMLLLAHKDSTTSQYQGVWEKFMAFLSRKRLSVSDMSVGVVCNFLHYQASVMGRKYRTLSNYRSALRLPLIYACNIDVKCLTSDLFLRGAYNFRPPVKAKPMPKWSLNMLLRFLSGPLFEPLDSASHDLHRRPSVSSSLLLDAGLAR